MIIKMETDNLEMYIIGIWIIRSNISQNISFCNCPHWEAQSPWTKCRRSFADILCFDWNPKDQTSRTARRSQCTFHNYNRSCWLLHSRKSGLYLRSACIQSCFSFNQLKRQFIPSTARWHLSFWGYIVPNSPHQKPHYRHTAQCAELKFKGLNFRLVPNLL